MKRSATQQLSLVIALFGAAAPFAVAFIRNKQAPGDLRYLWMAVTTLGTTALVIALRRPRDRSTQSVWGLSALLFVIDTLVAAATAYVLGVRAAPGLWLVAIAFGLSWAATHAFFVWSHPTAPWATEA